MLMQAGSKVEKKHCSYHESRSKCIWSKGEYLVSFWPAWPQWKWVAWPVLFFRPRAIGRSKTSIDQSMTGLQNFQWRFFSFWCNNIQAFFQAGAITKMRRLLHDPVGHTPKAYLQNFPRKKSMFWPLSAGCVQSILSKIWTPPAVQSMNKWMKQNLAKKLDPELKSSHWKE